MAVNGWEHYDLEKEMGNSNMAQLLEIFKRESDKYSNRCRDYVNMLSSLTDDGKKEIEGQCQLLEERRMKVALLIAERLTDIKRIEYEVRPNKRYFLSTGR